MHNEYGAGRKSCRTLDLADDCKKSNTTNSARQCQKLGGAAEHLIDGSKKRICLLSCE